MEIPLPDAKVELPELNSSVGSRPPINKDTSHVKRQLSKEEKKKRDLEYLEEKNVYSFLNIMLLDLFDERPSDPMDWCMAFLMRHDDIPSMEAKRNSSNVELSEDLRKWSLEWKIPFMFDDLLSDMLNENPYPAEPDRYAMAWFRWNKKSFRARHLKGRTNMRVEESPTSPGIAVTVGSTRNIKMQ
eukprot:Sspe_Gene.55766::Locus_30668_Transcript_2_2_Confidence_0.667_Length_709::g.55766::m.55766